MEVANKVAIVTGGARGIGRAICERFANEGAKAVIVADRDLAEARKVADAIGGIALACDVGIEAHVQFVVQEAINCYGAIDVFVSNAGITTKGGVETTDADWQRLWDVNVMSRVYAARAVVPTMLKQGGGYLIHVASAAGLLTEIGSAAYSVTKHADLALAEWLSVQYGRDGIRVSCVCPLGVETDMLDPFDPIHQFLQVQSIPASAVAEAVIQGMAEETFLILPHPQVKEFFQMKADDHDRWIRGMQRLNQKLTKKRNKAA
jgi:NAD(P)-dependent dehydrogenase (short-subunit alcohol dehydrogenase family)